MNRNDLQLRRARVLSGGRWRTVGGMLARAATDYPDVCAVVGADRRLSYAEYFGRCRRLANALGGLGVGHGDRVAILSRNSVEFCEVYGACEIAGYIAAPLNFRLTAPELAKMLARIDAKAFIFESAFEAVVRESRGLKISLLRQIVVGDSSAGALGFEALIAGGEDRAPPTRVEPEDVAYLMSTSGTTGTPKFAIRTHRTSTIVAELLASDYRTPQCGATLVTTPLFHVGGKDLRASQLWRAGTAVILRDFDPVKVLQTVQSERIAAIFLVATQLQAIMDVPNLGEFDLSSLVTVSMAGAPCPAPLLSRAIRRLGRIFCVQYGMTENMIATLHRNEFDPDGSPAQVERIKSVGHSISQGELTIADEQGHAVAQRVPGEVCVRSETMFEGYWNDDAASAAAMRNGWFRTGDIGYVDEQGYLFLVDRAKDMIISGGENVYCSEVEAALLAHPEVIGAAVIGVPHPRWGETVRACVIKTAGAGVQEQSLIDHCRKLIARYKCPTSVFFVDSFPLTANGKISKVELRKLYGAPVVIPS